MHSKKTLMGILSIVTLLVTVTVAVRVSDHGTPIAIGSKEPASPGAVLGVSSTSMVKVGKLVRSYSLYLPASYQAGRPTALVVAYHGEGDTAAAFQDQTGLKASAEAYGFMVASPEGWRPEPNVAPSPTANAQTWNDGSGLTAAGKNSIDDVAFTRALIADVAKQYTVDTMRTYAMGYANGGSMVLRLAVEQAGLFAAVAVDAPNGLNTATLKPARNVPFMMIQGGADPIRSKNTAGLLMSRLTSLFGCQSAINTRTLVSGVTVATYPICPIGMDASYVFINDMGHTWAGGEGTTSTLITGPTSTVVSATELMWRFLATHSLPTN